MTMGGLWAQLGGSDYLIPIVFFISYEKWEQSEMYSNNICVPCNNKACSPKLFKTNLGL